MEILIIDSMIVNGKARPEGSIVEVTPSFGEEQIAKGRADKAPAAPAPAVAPAPEPDAGPGGEGEGDTPPSAPAAGRPVSHQSRRGSRR